MDTNNFVTEMEYNTIDYMLMNNIPIISKENIFSNNKLINSFKKPTLQYEINSITKERSSILIVDDDIGMTETLQAIFEESNYTVYIAHDGYQAINAVKKNKFDFILMDIKMPGLNGVETYKKIKEISSATKVIMMTGFTNEELIDEAMKLGAKEVFNKPLNIPKLMNCIKK